MAFTPLYDGGMPLAPTRQMVPLSQNTEVFLGINNGSPVYLPQNVHGSDPSGDAWLGFSRTIFGFSLRVGRNASIRVLLYMHGTDEIDWRGWRLYKDMPNVLTGYELPPHQFKVMLYADEPFLTQFKGFVSLRSF